MDDITIQAQAGQIEFSLKDQSGQTARFSIPLDQAECLALQLLDLVGQERGPQSGSLWDQTPMTAAHNPRLEAKERDDRKTMLALGIGNWRPIYLILDGARLGKIAT